MRLGTVAYVRSGLVLSRKKADEGSKMHYPLLTLRCILPSGRIDMEQLDEYDASERLGAEYLSQTGDIIVRLSAPYTAILIDEQTAGIVVSSNFLIIRADRDKMDPAYLFWLLNTPRIKRRIYENATSNMLGVIKAKFFTDMEIAELPLNNQRAIAQLNLLAQQEQILLQKLAEVKQQYHSAIVESLYQQTKRGNRK